MTVVFLGVRIPEDVAHLDGVLERLLVSRVVPAVPVDGTECGVPVLRIGLLERSRPGKGVAKDQVSVRRPAPELREHVPPEVPSTRREPNEEQLPGHGSHHRARGVEVVLQHAKVVIQQPEPFDLVDPLAEDDPESGHQIGSPPARGLLIDQFQRVRRRRGLPVAAKPAALPRLDGDFAPVLGDRGRPLSADTEGDEQSVVQVGAAAVEAQVDRVIVSPHVPEDELSIRPVVTDQAGVGEEELTTNSAHAPWHRQQWARFGETVELVQELFVLTLQVVDDAGIDRVHHDSQRRVHHVGGRGARRGVHIVWLPGDWGDCPDAVMVVDWCKDPQGVLSILSGFLVV